MNAPAQTQQQVQIKYDDATIKGVYANAAQVQFQKEEVVFDFMNQIAPVATLNARVIVSPAHAKRLAAVLADVVKQYEARFGVIAAGEQPSEIGFTTK